MGTRSTVRFIQITKDRETGKKKEEKMCTIYQQFDGYPSGVGMELAEFLKPIKMVNGIGGDTTNIANGTGCLAAQYIAAHKTDVGGFYMTNLEDSQEYDYDVLIEYDDRYQPKQPIIRLVDDYDGSDSFEGTPEEFIERFSD